MENIGTDKIAQLVEFFKFGYQGDTQDLFYLAMCLYATYKLITFLFKKIRKGSGI